MTDLAGTGGRPRWHWEKSGPSRLFAGDGTEFIRVDSLTPVEIEGLVTRGELEVVEIGCGAGVLAWVGPPESERLWRRIEPLFEDVEPSRPYQLSGYRAELWRAADGRHVIVFSDE